MACYLFPEIRLEGTLAIEIRGFHMMKRLVQQGLAALLSEAPARERMEELDGYEEYKKKVRFRLIPFVWWNGFEK